MHNYENRELSEHQEMYLKTIFTLVQDHKVARVKEIAEELEVTKSSVSGAVKSLAEKGLVQYDPYSYVELTPRGEELASALLNKFDILTDFLVEVLDIPQDMARANACRMEHVVDDQVMQKLLSFLEWAKGCDIQCWKDGHDATEVGGRCCTKSENKPLVPTPKS